MVRCKKDPLAWAVSNDPGNVHKFEQEFRIILFGIKSNLKQLEEMVLTLNFVNLCLEIEP